MYICPIIMITKKHKTVITITSKQNNMKKTTSTRLSIAQEFKVVLATLIASGKASKKMLKDFANDWNVSKSKEDKYYVANIYMDAVGIPA